MNEYKPFRPFQYRYEKLTQGNRTYLYRWTLLVFGFSLRLHHWIGDDVGPHLHDHASDFISFLFKGSYTNHTPNGSRAIRAPFVWKSKATDRHRLEISRGGAWTILFCGRPYRKWGFWVNNHLWRPLRYFHKYGYSK